MILLLCLLFDMTGHRGFSTIDVVFLIYNILLQNRFMTYNI